MNIKALDLEECRTNKTTCLSIFEMVEDICSQINQLDAARQYMFMEWLLIHSHDLNRDSKLRDSLAAWLGSMSCESVTWEYELIMTEIKWWRDLDESRLVKIVLECLRNSS